MSKDAPKATKAQATTVVRLRQAVAVETEHGFITADNLTDHNGMDRDVNGRFLERSCKAGYLDRTAHGIYKVSAFGHKTLHFGPGHVNLKPGDLAVTFYLKEDRERPSVEYKVAVKNNHRLSDSVYQAIGRAARTPVTVSWRKIKPFVDAALATGRGQGMADGIFYVFEYKGV